MAKPIDVANRFIKNATENETKNTTGDRPQWPTRSERSLDNDWDLAPQISKQPDIAAEKRNLVKNIKEALSSIHHDVYILLEQNPNENSTRHKLTGLHHMISNLENCINDYTGLIYS